MYQHICRGTAAWPFATVEQKRLSNQQKEKPVTKKREREPLILPRLSERRNKTPKANTLPCAGDASVCVWWEAAYLFKFRENHRLKI